MDNKLEIVAKAIKSNNTFKSVNFELENNLLHPLTVTEDEVERMVDLQYGSPAILPILQILYPHLDYKNSTFHIDHIFPKSKFNEKNDLIEPNYLDNGNYLYNLQLLQGEENNSKRAKDPEIWITEEFYTDDKISDYKLKNYIKQGLTLEWKNIAEFDLYRSEKLITELKKILLIKTNQNIELNIEN